MVACLLHLYGLGVLYDLSSVSKNILGCFEITNVTWNVGVAKNVTAKREIFYWLPVVIAHKKKQQSLNQQRWKVFTIGSFKALFHGRKLER